MRSGRAAPGQTVARASAGDPRQTQEILTQAIHHKGFSLVDIFQPCVVFNKVNTYQWFKERIYYLEKEYDQTNRAEAFARALEDKKLPLGVFYRNDNRAVFEEEVGVFDKDKRPLWQREADWQKIEALLRAKR